MAADIAKLEKILRKEAADHYRDQLVYRGLAAFISNWTRESINSNPSPDDTRLVEQVADRLIDYGAMSVLQRAKAIQGVLDLIYIPGLRNPPKTDGAERKAENKVGAP